MYFNIILSWSKWSRTFSFSNYNVTYTFISPFRSTHPSYLTFLEFVKRATSNHWIFHPINYGLRRIIFSFLMLFTLSYFPTFSTVHSANPVSSLTVNLSFAEQWVYIHRKSFELQVKEYFLKVHRLSFVTQRVSVSEIKINSVVMNCRLQL
jgi:hypothetical protein